MAYAPARTRAEIYMLALAQYYAFEPLSFPARGAILAASFVLAALSWRFIEQPFRDRGVALAIHKSVCVHAA